MEIGSHIAPLPSALATAFSISSAIPIVVQEGKGVGLLAVEVFSIVFYPVLNCLEYQTKKSMEEEENRQAYGTSPG
jgi:hypothetical protein